MKTVTYEEVKQLTATGKYEFASARYGPLINYREKNPNDLPHIIVDLFGDYFIMSPEEFLSESVQKDLQTERSKLYGELVCQERVGS